MLTLNRFLGLRKVVLAVWRRWIVFRNGASIHPGANVSLSATLICGRRGAITIDDGALVAFKSLLIACTPEGVIQPISIGRNCFIGGGATILPGVAIAEGSIVGAGAVVHEDVPARTMVAGNPAQVIRRDIAVRRFGRLLSAGSRQADLAEMSADALLQDPDVLRAIRASRNCTPSQSNTERAK